MEYKYLPEHLQPTADRVAQYLEDDRGFPKCKAEVGIDDELTYRPTVHTVTSEKSIICVEVAEDLDCAVVEPYILDLVRLCLPVHLYVAAPLQAPDVKGIHLASARKHGIGLLAVGTNKVEVIQEALALSLFGVRPIDRRQFPKKYRNALAIAEHTFRNGNPAKGCSMVFDEIEGLTREIAVLTQKKAMWRQPKANEKPPRINLSTGNWQKVTEVLIDWLVKAKFREMSTPLISKVLGIIPQRNESGHKPKTIAQAIQREQQLRTRFEFAADLLHELVVARAALK